MRSSIFQANAVLILWLTLFCVPPPSVPRVPEPQPAIYVRVVRVDQAAGEVEVKFAVAPAETRILFAGDPKGISEGDYVKMRLEGKKATLNGAEMRSVRVTWKF